MLPFDYFKELRAGCKGLAVLAMLGLVLAFIKGGF